jgi:hypothetical protein
MHPFVAWACTVPGCVDALTMPGKAPHQQACVLTWLRQQPVVREAILASGWAGPLQPGAGEGLLSTPPFSLHRLDMYAGGAGWPVGAVGHGTEAVLSALARQCALRYPTVPGAMVTQPLRSCKARVIPVCRVCVPPPPLPRATSGLLVFSLNKHLQRWLGIAFEKRRVYKKYEALVVPTPDAPEPTGTGVVTSSVCRRRGQMWYAGRRRRPLPVPHSFHRPVPGVP